MVCFETATFRSLNSVFFTADTVEKYDVLKISFDDFFALVAIGVTKSQIQFQFEDVSASFFVCCQGEGRHGYVIRCRVELHVETYRTQFVCNHE